MSTWLLKTELQPKLVFIFLMENSITFVHENVWENLVSGGLVQGTLTPCQQKRYLC